MNDKDFVYHFFSCKVPEIAFVFTSHDLWLTFAASWEEAGVGVMLVGQEKITSSSLHHRLH